MFHLSMCGMEQGFNQRYVSLPTLRQARQAAWFFVFGFSFAMGFAMYNGLLLFTLYRDCDPLTTGIITRKDHLVPLLVMETMGQYPIVNGLFIAAVISAALSSVSTALNSMSAVVLEDFVKRGLSKRPSERVTGFILRGSVIIFGLLTMVCVFYVEQLGHVLEICLGFLGLTNGPLLGIFIIGLTMPWIGGKTVLGGALSGSVITGWMILQSQADVASKTLTYKMKPLSTDGCTYSFNSTIKIGSDVDSDREFYHISYLYQVAVGLVLTLILSNMFFLLFGRENLVEVNMKLLIPQIRKTSYKSREIIQMPRNEELLLMTEAQL